MRQYKIESLKYLNIYYSLLSSLIQNILLRCVETENISKLRSFLFWFRETFDNLKNNKAEDDNLSHIAREQKRLMDEEMDKFRKNNEVLIR